MADGDSSGDSSSDLLPQTIDLAGGLAPGTAGVKGTWPPHGPRTDEGIFGSLRDLATGSIEGRQKAFIEGTNAATRRTGGSAVDLLSGLRDQVSGLRQQLVQRYQAASRSLGPSGSKQIEAQQGAAMGQAGSQLNTLFQQYLGGQGNTALAQLYGALRPALATQLPPQVELQGTGPTDFTSTAGLVKAIGNLYNALGQRGGNVNPTFYSTAWSVGPQYDPTYPAAARAQESQLGGIEYT